MSPLSGFVDVASEWLLAALGAIGSGVLSLAGYSRSANQRSKKNERRLEGDPDNPNHDGVMDIVSDNNQKIDHLEERMDEQHRAVLDRIEDLAENDSD